LLQPHRQYDETCLHDEGGSVRHAIGQQRITHQLNDESPQKGCNCRGPAAAQQCTPHCYCRNGIKLHAEAYEVCISGGVHGDHHEARNRSAKAGNSMDDELHPPYRNSRKPGRSLIATDCQKLPAQTRVRQNERRNSNDDDHDPHLERDTRHAPNGNGLEFRNLEHLQVAIR
jgi:hypothetical protein